MRKALLSKVGLSLVALLLADLSPAANNMPLAFEDLPALVQNQNKNTLSGTGFLKAAEVRKQHLKRSFLPTLKAEAGYESFKTGVYDTEDQPYGDVEARINLYRGNRDVYEDRVRRAEAVSASASATRTYREELLKARKAFWELVHVQEVSDLLNEFVEQNRRHITGAEKRANRGITTETDRLGFQMVDMELREEIESHDHEVVMVEAELSPLVGIAAGTRIETVQKVAHAHRTDLIEASASGETSPDIAQSRSNRQAAEAQRKSSLSLWKPAVDVYGGYYLYTLRDRDYLSREDRDDTAVGVKASLFLFEGFQAKNQADSLDRKADAFEAQSEYLSSKLESDISILKEELLHIDDLVHSSEKQIEVAKKYLARTLDEYDRGVKNAPDVMTAFEKHIRLQRQYAERRRDYKLTEAKLMELIGQ